MRTESQTMRRVNGSSNESPTGNQADPALRSNEMEVVCFALALHLEIDPREIHEAQHLEDDLGLDPLDLVLVVLRLEEIGDDEFPVGDLEGVFTVKDLANVVRTWTEGPPTLRVPDTQVYAAAMAS